MIIHKEHFTNRKGYKMYKKLLAWFVVWYRKWVLGECRHFCNTCKFKKDCLHDTDWWLDINTLWILDGESEDIGRWEFVQYDGNPDIGNWHCSECRSVVIECVNKEEKSGIPLYKYCPQCGARMVETQESEDKE